MLDLVCSLKGVVDPLDELWDTVGRVKAEVRIGMAGEVCVSGHLPATNVDCLEPRSDHLQGLTSSNRAQCLDEMFGLKEMPEFFSTESCKRMLYLHGASELAYL